MHQGDACPAGERVCEGPGKGHGGIAGDRTAVVVLRHELGEGGGFNIAAGDI